MAPTAAGGPGLPSSSAVSAASGVGSGAKSGIAIGALGGGGGGVGPAGMGMGLAGGGSPRPEPRWKHTATVIDESRILIFGGYKSSSQRYVAFFCWW